jgi:hypothetical protein
MSTLELELAAPRAAGTLALTRITIDGTPLDLDGILADVVIRHGRAGYFDSPSPSTAQLTLLGVTHHVTRPFRLGSTLVVYATDGTAEAARFTGRFTDATLDGDRLSAIAVSAFRLLSGYTVGATDYPSENWSARVQRAFADAGIASALLLQAGPVDPRLRARPADPVALDSYLGDLVASVPAAIADTPDGRVLVQAISSRSLAAGVELDPAEVTYTPEWSIKLPGANIVTITYGDPEATLTRRDDGSVSLYGPIPVDLRTELADLDAAEAAAAQRLAADAYSHWNILGLELLVGRGLPVGTPLFLGSLPASAPFDPWTPILEGWTDHVVSDGDELDWTMELALSDPLLSGLTLPWLAVPAEMTWQTINQAVVWSDALTLDDLEP